MEENKYPIRPKKEYFNFFDAALASILFIIYNFIFLEAFAFVPMSVKSNSIVLYIAQFLIEFLFALVALTVAGSRRIKITKAAGMNKKVNLKLILLCLLISIVALVGFGNLTNVFIAILEKLGYSSSSSDIVINSFGSYFIYVLVICATPAICEELLFRGVILSGLKKIGPMFALLVSSAIFMLMHGSPDQTVHQFIIGLVVGYIFLKTGNLWLGVLVHFFNNFISITEYYILKLISTSTDVAPATTSEPTFISILLSFAIGAAIAVVAYIIIKLLIRVLAKENEKINSSETIETNTEILVDGNASEAVMEIDGRMVEPNLEKAQAQSETVEKETEDKGTSAIAIVLMVLSCGYLIFDWIVTLLHGFGLF
ncbi:MAG: CPBP family intramembrane metalloprotease [Clostridia bacterium]|nr:CPBP family intramembrane metalloprotease [Clostridia bacterium]